jgi:hypothetical protein
LRELLAIVPRSPGPKHVVVEQVMGISLDEAGRMRDADRRWIRNVYPLIDRRMTRPACLAWLAKQGYPTPPKSACTFCPYHDAAMWRALKRDDPAGFAEACELDDAIRPGIAGPKRPAGDAWYVHPARIPLRTVDLSTAEERGQGNLFQNECTGHCGV